MPEFVHDPRLIGVFWSMVTIALYLASKALHRHWTAWWTSPLIIGPLSLVCIALALRVSYDQYIAGTYWLVTLFAPATVAFAVPIYEQRALIRRYWLLLVIGAIVGSVTAIASSWALAKLFGLDNATLLSMLPRSVSTPFAMAVSGRIGGIPPLTAVFVLVTGIIGTAIGEGMLSFLPLRSALARGALFGMGAHGFGAAKAHQIDHEIGSIAGLVMVFGGVLNVFAAPLLALSLHH